MTKNNVLKGLFILASTAIASVAIASINYDELIPAHQVEKGTRVVCYAEAVPSGFIFQASGKNKPHIAQGKAYRNCINDDNSHRCVSLGCRPVD
jgi:hypothetical protein